MSRIMTRRLVRTAPAADDLEYATAGSGKLPRKSKETCT